MLFTHYKRVLNGLALDHVHIKVNGSTVKSLEMEPARQLRYVGYKQFRSSMTPIWEALCAKSLLFQPTIDGSSLVYLDSTNRSQELHADVNFMPDFMCQYYAHFNRGVCNWVAAATYGLRTCASNGAAVRQCLLISGRSVHQEGNRFTQVAHGFLRDQLAIKWRRFGAHVLRATHQNRALTDAHLSEEVILMLKVKDFSEIKSRNSHSILQVPVDTLSTIFRHTVQCLLPS